jgi:hypothetical protein
MKCSKSSWNTYKGEAELRASRLIAAAKYCPTMTVVVVCYARCV